MRNLALVSTSLAVVAGITAANLWRELYAERELTASLRIELAQAMARPPAQGQWLAMPPTGTAASRELEAQPSTATTPPAPAPLPVATPQPAATPTTAEATLASLNASMLRQQELLKDPEYRAAQLAQLRMTLPQNYPGLVEELQLTPEEAGKLFDLLARQQLEMNQSTTPLLANSNTDPAELQERSRVQAALRERQQAELATHLGGRYSQWETYQQDRSVHMQVATLRRNLDSVGQALPEAQVRPLVAALANEQQRTRQQTTDMLRNLGRPADPQSQAEFQLRRQEEQLRLLVESNQRVLDAARSHLNAAQFDTFRSMLDAQVAMSRASARAAREQAASQGAQTATAVPGINIAY